MLLDNYDPNSIKLFSKCARNQASKLTQKKRPHSSGRPYSSLMTYTESEKKKKILCTFDMSESREQRQKKTKPTLTPAVGQYNPKIENKVKLTWDILKIYNNPTQSRKDKKRANNSTHSQIRMSNSHVDESSKQKQKDGNVVAETELDGQDIRIVLGENGNDSGNNDSKIAEENIKSSSKSYARHDNMRFLAGRRLKSENNRYKTIKSQVDMSRMTGRIDSKQSVGYDDEHSPDLDASKSIEYLKSKPSLNVHFDHQLSRQKVESLKKPNIVPSDYSYDYSILKPKSSKVVPFGKSVGRDAHSRNKNQLVYSYTHYDYDKYVWASKSNVYTNTKTNVVDFKKQTNRVLFKR